MRTRRDKGFGWASAVPLLLGLLTAPASQALQVQAVVTDQGGFFHYQVRVLNDDPLFGLIGLSITDAPAGDPLIAGSLSAPPGFLGSYDAGLGIIDLLTDTVLEFPPGATEFLDFDSLASPLAAFTSYQVFDANLNFVDGQIASQLVQNVSAPGTLALLALGFGFIARRRSAARGGESATPGDASTQEGV